MRSSGNFSPEWGYLAPAPSFARTARVVLVATAIGATAGAGVVLSLINRPAEPEKTPIAARAIVTSVRAAAVPSAAPSVSADVVAAPAGAPAVAASPLSKRDVVRAPSQAQPRPQPQAAKLVPSQPSNGFAASVAAAPASAPAPAAAPSNVSAPPKLDVAARPPAEPNASAAIAATSAQAPAEPASVAAAAPANATENPSIMEPETAPPPKKAKKHASKQNAPPSVGSILRRLFAAQSGRSSYPNSASNRGL
jgi:hypothetical protein